jgi:hypothetical protein
MILLILVFVPFGEHSVHVRLAFVRQALVRVEVLVELVLLAELVLLVGGQEIGPWDAVVVCMVWGVALAWDDCRVVAVDLLAGALVGLVMFCLDIFEPMMAMLVYFSSPLVMVDLLVLLVQEARTSSLVVAMELFGDFQMPCQYAAVVILVHLLVF